MALSAAGATGIMVQEGLETTGYFDTVGVPTACYGHTKTAVVGKVYPLSVCKELFAKDISEFESTVNKNVVVPLTQSQFDALVSFCYNVGSYNCKTSTMFTKLSALDYSGAAKEFDRWTFATRKGKKVQCSVRANQCYGVYSRRMSEKALFESGAY
jgi:lysozyme